jgi:hypothetical protein
LYLFIFLKIRDFFISNKLQHKEHEKKLKKKKLKTVNHQYHDESHYIIPIIHIVIEKRFSQRLFWHELPIQLNTHTYVCAIERERENEGMFKNEKQQQQQPSICQMKPKIIKGHELHLISTEQKNKNKNRVPTTSVHNRLSNIMTSMKKE